MVTYDELFTFVTMLCAVVTLVVTLTQHKKQRPRPGKIRRYFQQITLPAAGLHPAFGSLVKYIIAKYTKMSNSKNRPGVTSTRTAISPERYTSQIHCIISGAAMQAEQKFAGCYFCTYFHILYREVI